MTLHLPVGRLPEPPEGWALRSGHHMGAADIVLAAKAALSRDLRGDLHAVKRPHPSLKRPQKHLDTATVVLLDATTRLVVCSDQTFFIHCQGRALPFSWGPADTRINGAQSTTAAAWARGHLPTWRALAEGDWTLAPKVPQAMPTPFACPLWLEVDAWKASADRLLPAVTALVDSVALAQAPESRGWTMVLHNGVLKPTGFAPGFLIYDAHAAVHAQGRSLGLTAQVQNALTKDGRLDRLLGSHHLLVHRCTRGADHLPACGQHGAIASFQVGSSSAHQCLAGLAELGHLLDELP